MDDDRSWLRPLGQTGLTVSAVTAGGGPLGSMPTVFGYEVAEEDAIDLVRQIARSPIAAIDTSNGYSEGRSEQRIGAALRRFDVHPTDLWVATKVDPVGRDYSGDRVRESVRETKRRLGVETLPLVHLHDPEDFDFADLTRPGGAVEALVELKKERQVGCIGVAGGTLSEMRKYLDLDVFDVLLTHSRWTLVDRSADALIDEAWSRGLGVINAAVYGGGLLTAAPIGKAATTYGYRLAPPQLLAATAAMRAACRRYQIDLATAALAFSLSDPRIATTVVGISKTSRLQPLLESAVVRIPADLSDELDTLVPDRSAWLDG